MGLRWGERMLLASGVTRWVAPGGGVVGWGGTSLVRGWVYHGWVGREERVCDVLQRLGASGDVALVDVAGAVDGASMGGGAGWWLVRADEQEVADAAALVGLWGAFEASVVVIQTSREEPERRRRLARRWLAVVEALPPRPWLMLGVGEVGYLDPLLRVVRDRGVSLLKVEGAG